LQPQDWTEGQEPNDRPGNWAFQLALCLLGPLFYLSYILTILAPLPLLYLHAGTPSPKRGRFWVAIAFFIGLGICFSIKGLWGGLSFALLASLPAAVLGELLIRKKGPERAVLGAMLAVLATALLGAGLAHVQGTDLIEKGRVSLDAHIQQSVQMLLDHNPPEQNVEELKKVKENPALFYPDLPGIGISLIFLLCTLPTLALIRWNPKGFLRRTGIPRDFLRKWKTPEWLVWPALACGLFHIVEVKYLSAISRNALNTLLVIYFFQGMSILAYFLDSLRLRGPIRVLIYSAGTVFLTPMVVSFGFFDLWFNFRGRHKPPAEDKTP